MSTSEADNCRSDYRTNAFRRCNLDGIEQRLSGQLRQQGSLRYSHVLGVKGECRLNLHHCGPNSLEVLRRGDRAPRISKRDQYGSKVASHWYLYLKLLRAERFCLRDYLGSDRPCAYGCNIAVTEEPFDLIEYAGGDWNWRVLGMLQYWRPLGGFRWYGSSLGRKHQITNEGGTGWEWDWSDSQRMAYQITKMLEGKQVCEAEAYFTCELMRNGIPYDCTARLPSIGFRSPRCTRGGDPWLA